MRRAKAPILSFTMFAGLVGLASTACDPPPPPVAPVAPAPPPAPVAAPAPRPKLDAIPRPLWNQTAAAVDLPLFWVADRNGNGVIDPDELAVLWGVSTTDVAWVKDGAFTDAFYEAHAKLVDALPVTTASGAPKAREARDAAESRRDEAVHKELDQGMPTLVRSDFRNASAEDRAIVDHVLAAAIIVERIFAKQRGVDGMADEIPAKDTASRMLFHRNQGPWCEAPKTNKDPDCNALGRRPPKLVGLYPVGLQREPKFCEKLEGRPDQKALLSPFNVVVEANGDLKPVPYHVAYKTEMEAVSRELMAAAQAIQSPGEAAFKAYLEADAKAFLDGNWDPADEAWSRMSVQSSKWYLRVAPDEVYTDPCSRKAGFQVSFARINQDSVAWQQKLEPHRTEMEEALAKLAGAPYKARKVTFHLPDFIDVIINAGDSRSPLGATIGESLPNWGPVADEGRGRTVAMTNFYTDPDSRADAQAKAKSVLCASSFDAGVLDPRLGTMSTVLHEASHNLGPANEYRVKVPGLKRTGVRPAEKPDPAAARGFTSSEIFGGPLASTLEELKAQTSAAYFADWLVTKSVIDAPMAANAHVADMLWAFGHISQGMYGGDGSVKAYSQLASIEIGSYIEAGAVAWRANEKAANGTDLGCFAIDAKKLPGAIASLEKKVVTAMGRGDKAAATKLKTRFVDEDGEWKRLRGVITERWLRFPRATFVYAVER